MSQGLSKLAALTVAMSLAGCAASPVEMRLVAVDGPELAMKVLSHHSDVVEIESEHEMVICFENCVDGRKGTDEHAIWLYFAEPEETQIVFSELDEGSLGTPLGEVARARVFSKNFDFDSSRLVGDLRPLEKLLGLAEEHPSLPVVIQGHTDSKGSLQYNKKLSFARAKAVGAWLVKNGVKQSRLQYESYGETRPIASNKTATGREKNRRADVVIRAVIASAPENSAADNEVSK